MNNIPTRTAITLDIAWIILRGVLSLFLVFFLSPLYLLVMLLMGINFILEKVIEICDGIAEIYFLKDTPIGYFGRAIKSIKVLARYKHWVNKKERVRKIINLKNDDIREDNDDIDMCDVCGVITHIDNIIIINGDNICLNCVEVLK